MDYCARERPSTSRDVKSFRHHAIFMTPTALTDNSTTRTWDEETFASDVEQPFASPESLADMEREETPRALFDSWFPSTDAVITRYVGDLGPSNLPGFEHELILDGEPLSRLLDPADLPYYREEFLPRILNGKLATWRSETLNGTVIDGCVAQRHGSRVELAYGERADGRPFVSETRPAGRPAEINEHGTVHVERGPAATFELDDLLIKNER